MLEVWQADSAGIYPHPKDPQSAQVKQGFRGWSRVVPDFETGLRASDTIKPGSAMGRNGNPVAPHVAVWVVSREINIGLNTRLYFADEDNLADPVLTLIEQPGRRATLIAQTTAPGLYRFDIRLQGDGETVFLNI